MTEIVCHDSAQTTKSGLQQLNSRIARSLLSLTQFETQCQNPYLKVHRLEGIDSTRMAIITSKIHHYWFPFGIFPFIIGMSSILSSAVIGSILLLTVCKQKQLLHGQLRKYKESQWEKVLLFEGKITWSKKTLQELLDLITVRHAACLRSGQDTE